MQSKNKKPMTKLEAEHVSNVKALECSVCDRHGPSEAHEIKQRQWFTSIALCALCHRDERNGWHGRKIMWTIKKMDELSALNVTLERLAERGLR